MGEARRRKLLGIERSHHSQVQHLSPVYRPGYEHVSNTDQLDGLETRKLIMLFAGSIKGTHSAGLLERAIRQRADAGDLLARQLLHDVPKLAGGTAAAVKARLHKWFAIHEEKAQ